MRIEQHGLESEEPEEKETEVKGKRHKNNQETTEFSESYSLDIDIAFIKGKSKEIREKAAGFQKWLDSKYPRATHFYPVRTETYPTQGMENESTRKYYFIIAQPIDGEKGKLEEVGQFRMSTELSYAEMINWASVDDILNKISLKELKPKKAKMVFEL